MYKAMHLHIKDLTLKFTHDKVSLEIKHIYRYMMYEIGLENFSYLTSGCYITAQQSASSKYKAPEKKDYGQKPKCIMQD